MFQAIKTIKYLGFNSTSQKWEHQHKLIDSDFGEIVVAAPVGELVGMIVSEYSKRGLDIAANVIRLCFWYEKVYGTKASHHLKHALKYEPLITPQLKEQLERYLILL